MLYLFSILSSPRSVGQLTAVYPNRETVVCELECTRHLVFASIGDPAQQGLIWIVYGGHKVTCEMGSYLVRITCYLENCCKLSSYRQCANSDSSDKNCKLSRYRVMNNCSFDKFCKLLSYSLRPTPQLNSVISNPYLCFYCSELT